MNTPGSTGSRAAFLNQRRSGVRSSEITPPQTTENLARMKVAPPLAIPACIVRWWYRRMLWREPRLRWIDSFLHFRPHHRSKNPALSAPASLH